MTSSTYPHRVILGFGVQDPVPELDPCASLVKLKMYLLCSCCWLNHGYLYTWNRKRFLQANKGLLLRLQGCERWLHSSVVHYAAESVLMCDQGMQVLAQYYQVGTHNIALAMNISERNVYCVKLSVIRLVRQDPGTGNVICPDLFLSCVAVQRSMSLDQVTKRDNNRVEKNTCKHQEVC